MLSLIAAQTVEGAIGMKGDLPWKKLQDDLDHFKQITSGHPVIMGRKTWESIPDRYRPLPGRANIVVSREEGYEASGAAVYDSLEEAISSAASLPGGEETFIIGGGQIYAQALPLADKVYLTVVNTRVRGDAFFPEMDMDEWTEESRSSFSKNGRNELSGTFINYVRNHA